MLIDRILAQRGKSTVRVTKGKEHADEEMVRVGQVRELDWIGNDAADEAADSGRQRVEHAVIDTRRNMSGVCRRWCPIILKLHRFFIAISRAVVNHDECEGTSPDPLVWSAGALPKMRMFVHAVRDHAMLPGPVFIWTSDLVSFPPATTAEDVGAWPYSVVILVMWVTFLGTLQWQAAGADLGGWRRFLCGDASLV